MRYLGDDDATQMKGIGLYLGDDGNLYQWVDGVDASDDAMGVWQGLSQPDDPALRGLGALYQAPDGTLYQVHGLAEETETDAKPEAQTEAEAAGGQPAAAKGAAQARQRFIQRRQQRPGQPTRGGTPRKKGGFFKKLLPIAKFATRFIPGIGPIASAGLDVAGKLLKRKGVSGYDGLGYLYAAPDGSLYQVQGLADEELRGVDADEELRGFEEDQDLRGLSEDEELRGFAEDEELRGIGEDRDIRGIEGYVQQDGMSGVDAYVPQKPPHTPWHVVSPTPPEIWRPLW